MLKKILKLDEFIWDWIQDHQNIVLDYFCRDLTSMGGSTVIPFVILFSSAILYITGQPSVAVTNMIAFFLASCCVTGLKEFFGRPGPLPYDPFHTGMRVHHFPAFPSGHTAMSVTVYVSLAILAAQALPACATLFIASALVLSLLIGIGKMYLGAHWLSDVIGGYALGLLFVYIWSLFV